MISFALLPRTGARPDRLRRCITPGPFGIRAFFPNGTRFHLVSHAGCLARPGALAVPRRRGAANHRDPVRTFPRPRRKSRTGPAPRSLTPHTSRLRFPPPPHPPPPFPPPLAPPPPPPHPPLP